MRLEELELLRGSVSAIVFQNGENGYTVLKLRCEDGSAATVTGVIPMTAVGERLIITGRWVSHPAYGRQFEAELLERLMPETQQEILTYLSSGVIRGIRAKTAQRIVEKFGSESLNVIENDPEQLAAISGISRKRALEMGESFRRQVGVRRIIEFFAANGIPAQLAMRVYRIFGEYAIDEIRENPYVLMEEDFGAPFAAVDAMAMRLGVEADDERRVEAGILFELSHNLSNGHVFLPMDKLKTAAATLLNLEMDLIDRAMVRLAENGHIAVDRVAKLEAVYLPEYFAAEQRVCSRLQEMVAAPAQAPAEEKLLERIQRETGYIYADEQRQAIRAAAVSQVLLITGGPGTGKTTTLRGIVELFGQMQLCTKLAAPTGRAAKRLSELTGCEVQTIHRLLEAQIAPETGQMVFARDENNPLKCSAMIVDETSMVDLLLMDSLLRATPSGCKLVFVGDPNQLPSVGAGNVFSDMIRSRTIATVQLTRIFRQAQESLIVMNSHAVNRGELPVLTAKDRDFFFLRRQQADALLQTVCDLCSWRLPKNMGIPANEIQVLSPTRKGDAGTYRLNRALQAVLNPHDDGKPEKQFGDFSFRQGDRVMQIRNNYDIIWKKVDGLEVGTGIFNGDIGEILDIDFAAETVQIQFDDRLADYSFDMLSELEPAYAMTVHKSQGSEYRAVILTAYPGSPYLMTRSILYTAITRARELLIVVGDESVIAAMTANDRQQKRYSGLKLRLENEV